MVIGNCFVVLYWLVSGKVKQLSRIFNLDEADKVEEEGVRTTYWLMNQDMGATKMRMVIYDFQPNYTAKHVHYHKERESAYVILEGTAIIHLNGQDHTLKKGQIAYLSPKDIHGVIGIGKDGLKMLEVWAPAERDTHYIDRE